MSCTDFGCVCPKDVTMVLTQAESPYWQNPPTALAMKVHNSKNIRSYGAAYLLLATLLATQNNP